MLFVISNPYMSAELRGIHIAQALGVPCRKDIGTVRDDSIVFVKETTLSVVHKAKWRGNRIIYDPLDWFCYDRTVDFGELVDVVIVPNRECESFYSAIFPKAKFSLIPHQWDYRINTQAPQDRLRIGYIGAAMNCPEFWNGERVTNGSDMISAVPRFNLHICLNRRTGNDRFLKPATKIVTAAAVGANAMTYADPSAIELLGENYPYIVRGDPFDTMRFAEETFGTDVWKRGLEIMHRVREQTEITEIARLYHSIKPS